MRRGRRAARAPSRPNFAHAPCMWSGVGMPSRTRLQLWSALGLFGAAAGVCTLGLGSTPPARAAAPLEARVQGERIADQATSALALRAARAFLRTPVKLVVGPWEFTFTRAELGAKVDLPALSAMLEAARDDQSALRRLHRQERGDATLELPVPARLEGPTAERVLLGIRDQVAQRARDARIDV